MTDIVERLRGLAEEWYEMCCDIHEPLGEAADEIERLRETVRQTAYVFELLKPENHSQTTDAELASLLSSVGEKLNAMIAEWDSAALGEKK